MTIPSAPVDTFTGSLLDLIADDADLEWMEYTTALKHVARIHGKILPNELREFTAGAIKPKGGRFCRTCATYRARVATT